MGGCCVADVRDTAVVLSLDEHGRRRHAPARAHHLSLSILSHANDRRIAVRVDLQGRLVETILPRRFDEVADRLARRHHIVEVAHRSGSPRPLIYDHDGIAMGVLATPAAQALLQIDRCCVPAVAPLKISAIQLGYRFAVPADRAEHVVGLNVLQPDLVVAGEENDLGQVEWFELAHMAAPQNMCRTVVSFISAPPQRAQIPN